MEQVNYLRKSATVYKIYSGLSLIVLVVTILKRILQTEQSDLLNLVVDLPIIAMFIMVPVGLYFSLKSYALKQGSAKSRFLYLIGHLFFALIVLIIIAAVVSDIGKIFI